MLLVRAGLLELVSENAVDKSVDAADEEAGHTGDSRNIAAGSSELLQPGDVCLGDVFIGLLREQQRDIYIDAFADQLLNRRNSGRSRRNFDHHVLARNPLPQPSRFLECACRVVRQGGGNFQAHVPITLLCSREYLRSEEHTSELQSQSNLVCRLLLEKKKNQTMPR